MMGKKSVSLKHHHRPSIVLDIYIECTGSYANRRNEDNCRIIHLQLKENGEFFLSVCLGKETDISLFHASFCISKTRHENSSMCFFFSVPFW